MSNKGKSRGRDLDPVPWNPQSGDLSTRPLHLYHISLLIAHFNLLILVSLSISPPVFAGVSVVLSTLIQWCSIPTPGIVLHHPMVLAVHLFLHLTSTVVKVCLRRLMKVETGSNYQGYQVCFHHLYPTCQ